MRLGTLPVYQCYDCTGCGACCGGYLAITVTPEEQARIQAQGWEADPALQGRAYFTRHGRHVLLAHREDGCCVFLNEEKRCRIHAKFGEEAKPLTCRLYPFGFVPAGDDVRTALRYDCPAVAENHGRPLSEHRAALTALLPQVVPADVRAIPAPPLLPGVPQGWGRALRLARAFEGLLNARTPDLTRRITAMVNLAAALHNRRLRDVTDRELDTLLDTAMKQVLAAAAQDALPRVAPTRVTAAMFRQLLGALGRRDRARAGQSLGWRLSTSIRMLGGRGPVPPLRTDFPAVTFAELDASFGLPGGAAADALVRYLRLRLHSLAFCGRAFYGRAVLDGLNALLLSYPLILWFARAHAAGRGAQTLDVASVTWGLQVVDHQYGRAPWLDLPSERFRQQSLCERSHLRSLVVWYGS